MQPARYVEKGSGPVRIAGFAVLTAALIFSLFVQASAGAVSRQRVENVITSLTIDKSRYAPTDEMKIVLTVRNRTRATVSYEFPTSQWFEIQVVAGKQILWTWSRGKAFTQAFTILVLKPGLTREFSLTWDLRSNEDKPVPPGSYIVAATFPVAGGTPALFSRAQMLRVPFSIVQHP